MIDRHSKLLVVDDNEDILLSLRMLLKPHIENIRMIKNPERISEIMDSFQPDVIILDMNFRQGQTSGEDGYKWLRFILDKNPNVVVLLLTAYVDTEKVVRAIKAGATDFIPKPWDNSKLLSIIESAFELSVSRRSAGSPPVAGNNVRLMIGESQAMKLLKERIEKIGATNANVLITGENGTGKDVVANLLHSCSPRSQKPLVTIDLGAIPEQLFESELFGYEKGAFTDARTNKEGRVAVADGGTVFLDEIGNLSLPLQQKLLTVIEKQSFAPLGSNKMKQVDVRIIAATNADSPQMVADGAFRQDLLYRINTFELHVPPLRERGNDIILLAEYFAEQIATRYKINPKQFSAKAKEKLLSHRWPGNVRELQHVVEQTIILSSGDIIYPDEIIFPQVAKSVENQVTLNLKILERETILKAIDHSNGNLSTAASLLGITRYALYRKIEKYGL